MKASNFLWGMLVCATLGACSDNEVVENPIPDNGTESRAYMKVKLVLAEDATSRGVTDGGYAVGQAYEQRIDGSKSIFLFYDKDGNFITHGVVQNSSTFEAGCTDSDTGHSSNSTESVDSEATDVTANDQKLPAYIVLSATDENIHNITQVLTVVNYSNRDALKYKKLSDVLAMTAEDKFGETEPTDDDDANAGTDANAAYLMTTSVYIQTDDNNNKTVVATTPITNDNIKTTAAEALKDNAPVKIHIERAAAKVQVLLGDSFTGNKTDIKETGESEGTEENAGTAGDMTIDGEVQDIQIEIVGWKLNNINTTTYLSKQIGEWATSNATDPFNNWNVPSNYRSYWAKGTLWDYAGGVSTLPNGYSSHPLKAYTYNDATNGVATSDEENAEYCWEQTVENVVSSTDDASNTTVLPRGTAYPNVTTVLIAAKFSIKEEAATTADDEEETEETTNYYKFSGIYYTETSYKNLILQQLEYAGYVKSVENQENTSTISSITAEDLNIDTDGTLAGVKVTVAENNTYKQKSTEKEGEYSDSSDEAINGYLNGSTSDDGTTTEGISLVKDVEGYAGGACYYQIPIEHISSTDESPLYGVVRNHWYQLSISGVKHVGAAVFNPDVEIPQITPETTEYYMAAELHVLNWHVVKQDVVLQ